MKEVFRIFRVGYTNVGLWGSVPVTPPSDVFATYPSAQAAIAELPPGEYQIEKVFIVHPKIQRNDTDQKAR
jgi:hypothetical protein